MSFRSAASTLASTVVGVNAVVQSPNLLLGQSLRLILILQTAGDGVIVAELWEMLVDEPEVEIALVESAEI
jgi:hypothetical protein